MSKSSWPHSQSYPNGFSCFKFFHSYPLFPVFIFLVFLIKSFFHRSLHSNWNNWIEIPPQQSRIKSALISFIDIILLSGTKKGTSNRKFLQCVLFCLFAEFLHYLVLMTLTLPEANIIEMKEFVIILSSNSFQRKDCYTKKLKSK